MPYMVPDSAQQDFVSYAPTRYNNSNFETSGKTKAFWHYKVK